MGWRSWAAIGLLAGILLEAMGFPLVLRGIKIISGWMGALPPPTEHFASIGGDWAWPIAALLIVYWLRRPLRFAVEKLAERIENDESFTLFGASFKRGDYKIPLKPEEAASEASAFAPDDVRIIEELYEFIGDTDDNLERALDWIEANVDPKLDPVDFMSEPVFAKDRAKMYEELVGGKNG